VFGFVATYQRTLESLSIARVSRISGEVFGFVAAASFWARVLVNSIQIVDFL
jgi:hypothetical protein